MIFNYGGGGNVYVDPPVYTYTGTHTFIDDGNGDWRIKFLTGGVLRFTKISTLQPQIDIFIVGGGGGGGNDSYAGGGGGGYTRTQKNFTVQTGVDYQITIGAGGAGAAAYQDAGNGGASSAFGYTANGGYGGCRTGSSGSGIITSAGGNGGSGGGNGGNGNGGSNGGDSPHAVQGTYDTNHQGKGQGTTTSEFGDAGAQLYAGGGGAAMTGTGGSGGGGNGANTGYAGNGTANTGGGGGASDGHPGSGGSGIVIIRNHR